MREAFELAAFRAGCRAARAGASHIDNWFRPGSFPDLARRWLRGWAAAIESTLPLNWMQPDEVDGERS